MTELLAGYGRVDITPDYPVPIAGGAAKRISEGFLDPLYVTCIALRQGEQTLLVATVDFVGAYEEYSEPAREAISQTTGVPTTHIIINATHTHSSVGIRHEDGLNILQYRPAFYAGAVRAAQQALADLAPAEVFCGSTQTKGMVWVRHYKMADGTYAGANYGSFKKSTILGHVSEADPEMQLIRLSRSGDRKDILLMNFPAHATLQKELMLSADFPGPARAYVEAHTDTLVAYFIAGAGDQVPSSRVKTEQFSADYRIYGEEVGRIAVACMKNLKKQEGTELRFACHTYTGKSNKEELDRAEDALAVRAIWEQVGGRGTPEGKEAAKSHGFSSVYQVTAILNRMKMADTRSVEMKALAIGDVSMIFAPYEMFGASAMHIKRETPYAMTFVVSCSQNHDGYMPSRLGWAIGCYESQITRFAPGTAEILAEEYVQLLTKMKNQ